MADTLNALLADLAIESATLLSVLQQISFDAWDTVTPSAPWTVKDQVSHLAWNDEATVLALVDPVNFLASKPTTPDGIQQMVDSVIVDNQHRSAADLLHWFSNARQLLLSSSEGLDAKTRMPWYGPDMSVMSKLSARFMETWAHGYDICEAVGVTPEPTDRIRHVVFLGLQAIPNSFTANSLVIPSEPVRLSVTSPGGEVWEMGKPDATNVVSGSAWDLALLVTQRINLANTDLIGSGAIADEWLHIAQAFAGPPGSGRSVRSR